MMDSSMESRAASSVELRAGADPGARAAMPCLDQGQLTILLIANYSTDRQESMQRFADLLEAELRAAGFATETIAPQPWIGLLKPAATGVGKWLGYLDKFVIFPFLLRVAVRRLRREQDRRPGARFIVHICDHSNSPYTAWLHDTPHLVTCHDLLAVRAAHGEFPQARTGSSGRILQRWIVRGLSNARMIVCDSLATESDVRRLVPGRQGKIRTIPIALNHPYRPMSREAALSYFEKLRGQNASARFFSPDGSYILHVGGNQWYKNRLGVVQIYMALRGIMADPPLLILVGKSLTAEVRAMVNQGGLSDSVFCFENCDNETLRALYSHAGCLLFPSLTEGFGWPVLEAMACGCPVVTSNRGSLPEVGGDAVVYVDPESHSEAARRVAEVLSESGVARAERTQPGLQRAAAFHAERMTRDYAAVYAELWQSSVEPMET